MAGKLVAAAAGAAAFPPSAAEIAGVATAAACGYSDQNTTHNTLRDLQELLLPITLITCKKLLVQETLLNQRFIN